MSVQNSLKVARNQGAAQNKGRGNWLVLIVSVIYALVGLAAVVGVFIDVETILGFGPTVTVLGLVIAVTSLWRLSYVLLIFGLLWPTTSAGLSITIATLSWSPGEAENPCRIIMTLAGVLTLMATILVIKELNSPRQTLRSVNGRSFQFSVFWLLGITTLCGIVLAIARWAWPNLQDEMTAFGLFGALVIMLCSAVVARFTFLAQRIRTESLLDLKQKMDKKSIDAMFR